MSIDKLIYYFSAKDSNGLSQDLESFIEVKIEGNYQWYHVTKDKTYKLDYLASGVTTDNENYRILKRNQKTFLMLFDDEYMKVSDRDILFEKKDPIQTPQSILDKLTQ